MTLIQRIILAVLFIIPIFAIGFFIAQGDEEPFLEEVPAKQNLPAVSNSDTLPPNHPDPQTQIRAMIEEIKQKIALKQHEFADIILLGRAYMMLKDFHKAAETFEEALLIEPNSLDALLPLADVLGVVQEGQLTGRPYELLQRALKIDPNAPMALWLIGNAEMQMNNPEQAAEYWTKLYYYFPEGSDNRMKIKQQLASIGKEPAPQATNTGAEPAQTETQTPVANQSILIMLDISPEIKEKLKGTTAFIYAKSQTGMPMPIAAKKIPGEALTSAITLTEADQLRPDRKLKDIANIKVGIKISHQKNVDNKAEIFRIEENLPESRKVNFVIQF